MDDEAILREIKRLADDQHGLGRASEGLEHAQLDRRREIEAALEQCWDLLRQRRARRRVGEDPAGAALRPVGVIAQYRQ